MTFYSQNGTLQDQWVAGRVGDLATGTFVDIGCGHWQNINNTLHFEERGWRGVAIDINPDFAAEWRTKRVRSRFVLADATELDYHFALSDLPELVDYLSIDLEPPQQSIRALRRVVESSGRRFRFVTFEHDAYRDTGTREEAREFLAAHGYVWQEERFAQDDFFCLASEVGTP